MNIKRRRRNSVPFSCGEEEKRREEIFYREINERNLMYGCDSFFFKLKEQRARERKESTQYIMLYWYTNKYSLHDYQFACEIGLYAFRTLLCSYNKDYQFVINDYVTYHTVQEAALMQHIFKEMKRWILYEYGEPIENSDDISRMVISVHELK